MSKKKHEWTRKGVTASMAVVLAFGMVPAVPGVALADNLELMETSLESGMMASVDGVGCSSLQEALARAKDGSVVELLSDIVLEPSKTDGDSDDLIPFFTINQNITIDLNDYSIAWDEEYASTEWGYTPVIFSIDGAEVSFEGSGTIDTELGYNNSYGVDIVNGGSVSVYGGTYTGATTAFQVTNGALYVYGGQFAQAKTISQIAPNFSKYVINCIDENFAAGSAKIVCKGGSFCFDISDYPEASETTYLADGYQIDQNGEMYLVSMEENKTVSLHRGGAYDTLIEAMQKSEDGDVLSLCSNVAESMTIPEGKSIVLDLAGYKLANSEGNHTIVNNGNLTVIDTGKTGIVDNTTHACASIYNNGEMTVEGGMFTRSLETQDGVEDGEDNSWYTVVNGGVMEISGGVFTTADGNAQNLGNRSSLIRNGIDSTETDNNAGVSLTIQGGEFVSGANVVKNEAGSVIDSITGGTFVMDNSQIGWFGGNNLLQNYGVIKSITGGTFKALGSGVAIDEMDKEVPTYFRHVIGVYGDGVIENIGGSATFMAQEGQNRVIRCSGSAAVSISGGKYLLNNPGEESNQFYFVDSVGKGLSITGGTFTVDPNEFVPSGYEAQKDEDGNWLVSEKSVVNPGGTGGGSTAPSEPEGEVTENPDGSTTTTVTEEDKNADGSTVTTVTETTEGREDGSVTEKVTETTVSEDGAKTEKVTETNTLKDGTSATTVAVDGELASVEATVTEKAVESAAGKAVELPMAPVEAASSDKAVEVKVEAPAGAKIAVPVAKAEGSESVAPGAVLVLVDAEGNETVLPKTANTGEALSAEIPGDCALKVVDASADFPDVDADDWYAEQGVADFISARGVMTGVEVAPGSFEFQGDAPTNRGMFVTMLNRLEMEAKAESGEGFADVDPGSWYAGSSAWAVEAGIATGYENADGTSTFDGDGNVTREQMATFLFRYAQWLGLDTSARAEQEIEGVSDFAKEAVSWAVAEGLIKGDDTTGAIRPGDGATRAEAAAVVMRMVGLMA